MNSIDYWITKGTHTLLELTKGKEVNSYIVLLDGNIIREFKDCKLSTTWNWCCDFYMRNEFY